MYGIIICLVTFNGNNGLYCSKFHGIWIFRLYIIYSNPEKWIYWCISLWLSTWNILWYWIYKIYDLLLGIQHLIFQVEVFLYHVPYEVIVHKHVTVDCSVKSFIAHRTLILDLHAVNIVIAWSIIIHMKYFIYLVLWAINCIQLQTVGPNFRSFSNFW